MQTTTAFNQAHPFTCFVFSCHKDIIRNLKIAGFVPREKGRFGQRFTVQATEAISEFERMNMKERAALNQIIKLGALQNGKWDPKNLEDKEVRQNFPINLFITYFKKIL